MSLSTAIAILRLVRQRPPVVGEVLEVGTRITFGPIISVATAMKFRE